MFQFVFLNGDWSCWPQITTDRSCWPQITTDRSCWPQITTDWSCWPQITTDWSCWPEITTDWSCWPQITTDRSCPDYFQHQHQRTKDYPGGQHEQHSLDMRERDGVLMYGAICRRFRHVRLLQSPHQAGGMQVQHTEIQEMLVRLLWSLIVY